MLPPPKKGSHHRVGWQSTDPAEILIGGRIDQLQGTFRTPAGQREANRARYDRAKKAFDMTAAVEIVENVVTPALIDRVIDTLLAVNKPLTIVSPHPEFDAGEQADPAQPLPKNALPFALAHHLAAELDCNVDDEIIEIARPGRTVLGLFPRFLWQPAFSGPVNPECAYIVVDDVCTTGGTLACLRSYIVRNGGTVIAAVALSNRTGRNEPFPIAERTVEVLNVNYSAGIRDLWVQEIGHGHECLTESEGQALARWHTDKCADCGAGASALQRLRNRLAEAAEKGS